MQTSNQRNISIESAEAIKLVVGQSTVHCINEIMEKPPGRSPDSKLINPSNWYNNLSNPDRENLNEVIKQTVDSCLFGIFCVIDGVRAIEGGPDKGELILEYRKDGKITRLNDQPGQYLTTSITQNNLKVGSLLINRSRVKPGMTE